MAHSTTLNSVTDALISSLISTIGRDTGRLRKARETFAKRLRHHNFARTNQSEVAERLTGVEEKFQILNQDNLSDALHARLGELKNHENWWLPDVLDLLLRLSNDPASWRNIESLHEVKQRAASPAPLTWSEIEADDPIDRDDPIWHIQDYSDLSSDEDASEFSYDTSPQSLKGNSQYTRRDGEGKSVFVSVNDIAEQSSVMTLREAQFWKGSEDTVIITEQQAVRECLFMLQGLPTTLFRRIDTDIISSSTFRLQHLSLEALSEVLDKFGQLGKQAQIIRHWLKETQETQELHYMQSLREGIQRIITEFHAALARAQADFVSPKERTVFSLVKAFDWVEDLAKDVVSICNLITQMNVQQKSQGHPLDVIFDHICLSQSCDEEINTVMDVFATTFEVYMKPITKWMKTGEIDSSLDPFFIQPGSRENRSRLWNDWFTFD